MMKYLIPFLITTFFSNAFAQSKIENPRPSMPIPNSYFGMHLRYGANTVNWPSQKFYSWRVITPETEWRGLEPQKGQWQFSALDNAVYRANFRNMEMILTLGQTPQWASARPQEIVPNGPGASAEPADIRDWENYIRTIATRYKGRIKYYELWNEPRFLEVDPYRAVAGFTGSARKMVEMGRVAKRILSEVDPDARLISPSTDSGLQGIKRLEAWLAAGGGDVSDVIGYHIYVTPPEKIPEVAAELRKVVNKYGLQSTEIWNTESGFLLESADKKVIADGYEVFAEVLSVQKTAAYVARSIILGAVSGLDRFYWYSWDVPGMALTNGRGKTVTQAGEAYLNTVKWIRGATLPKCSSVDNSIWVCDLARGGRVAHIAWNTGTERAWDVPAAWRAIRLEELNGSASTLQTRQTVTLGEAPVLLLSDGLPWGTESY